MIKWGHPELIKEVSPESNNMKFHYLHFSIPSQITELRLVELEVKKSSLLLFVIFCLVTL